MSFIRKRSQDAGKIDVSPMLDMVFILLIFFIVTSTSVTDSSSFSVLTPLSKKSVLMTGIARKNTALTTKESTCAIG